MSNVVINAIVKERNKDLRDGEKIIGLSLENFHGDQVLCVTMHNYYDDTDITLLLNPYMYIPLIPYLTLGIICYL